MIDQRANTGRAGFNVPAGSSQFAAASRNSAAGLRQMLPVHTVRILLNMCSSHLYPDGTLKSKPGTVL
jgi:hypothetical protein